MSIRTFCAALAALLTACGAPGNASGDAAAAPGKALSAYGSEAELAQALERWRSEAAARQQRMRLDSLALQMAPSPPMASPAPPPATAAPAAAPPSPSPARTSAT